jgi:hypothetical protein
MKSRPFPTIVCSMVVLLLLAVAGLTVAKDKKNKTSYCSNSHPEQFCTAANTCGANGSACILEVKRMEGGSGASVTPNVANFAENTALGVKTGASVTWQGAAEIRVLWSILAARRRSTLPEQLWEAQTGPLPSWPGKPVVTSTRWEPAPPEPFMACVGIQTWNSLSQALASRRP